MTSSAQLEAMPVEDVIAYIQAGRAGYTGTRYGEPFTDEHGTWQQVWVYVNGNCAAARVVPLGEQS